MNRTIETFDPDFRPQLRRYTVGDYNLYRQVFGMGNKGYPAPTLTQNKAAYWMGKPLHDHQLVPIIAVTVPKDKFGIDFSADWLVGTGSVYEVRQRAQQIDQEVGSVSPIGAAVLELANCGPYTSLDALELLVKLCPIPIQQG